MNNDFMPSSQITIFIPTTKGAQVGLARQSASFIEPGRFADRYGDWVDTTKCSREEVMEQEDYILQKLQYPEQYDNYKCAVVCDMEQAHFFLKTAFDTDSSVSVLICSNREDGLTMQEVGTKAFSAKVALLLAARARQIEEDLVEHVRMNPSAVTDSLKSAIGGTVVDLHYFVREDGEDWVASLSDTGVSMRYADTEYDGFKHFDWTEVPHHLLAQILKDPSVTELFNT